MTVKEILLAKFEELGADGLCNSYAECCCTKDDLMPCCDCPGDCVPGYAGKNKWDPMATEKWPWIYPTKEEAEASKCAN